MVMAKKTRITRKQINTFKAGNALGEPASLGASFVCNDLTMANALNWYNENRDVKKMRKYLEQYVTKNSPKKISTIFSSVADHDLSLTVCVIAKMILSNCKLEKNYIDFLNKRIKEIASKYEIVEVDEAPAFISNESATVADTEEILDEFYRSDYKASPIDYYKFLCEKSIKPSEARKVVSYYEPLLEEINTESDLNLTKKQKKSYQEFLSKILGDCAIYLSNSRKQTKLRKPRKKKVKSADQLVSRVKFKTSDTTLKITSINPTQVVGAESVWLFNSKYKRMTYLVAKANQTLSIKGTTIIGFDPTKSITKTIRKPENTIGELLNNSRIQMLKQFIALKTKAAAAKGRLNEDVLLLKVSK